MTYEELQQALEAERAAHQLALRNYDSLFAAHEETIRRAAIECEEARATGDTVARQIAAAHEQTKRQLAEAEAGRDEIAQALTRIQDAENRIREHARRFCPHWRRAGIDYCTQCGGHEHLCFETDDKERADALALQVATLREQNAKLLHERAEAEAAWRTCDDDRTTLQALLELADEEARSPHCICCDESRRLLAASEVKG